MTDRTPEGPKMTGIQFLTAQLTQAQAAVAALLDENADLLKKIEELKRSRPLPEGVTRIPKDAG